MSLLLPALFILSLAGFLSIRLWAAQSTAGKRKRLRETWGQADSSRRRDLESILALHRALRDHGAPGESTLAESAATDLDLDQLFAFLDRTLTEAGQQALAHLLRTPVSALPRLGARAEAISLLGRSSALREELQLALLPLAAAVPGTLVPLIASRGLAPLPLPGLVYRLCALAAVAAVPAPFFLGGAGWLLVAAMFIINGINHYSAEREVTAALPGIVALQELFGAAGRIVRASLPGLESEQTGLRELLAELGPLGGAIRGLNLPDTGDALSDLSIYLDIFVLRRVRLYSQAAPEVSAAREALLRMTLAVGTLDALQAMASVRAQRADHCVPVLDFSAPALRAEEVRHPLLEGAVANSLELSGGVLITGSNMSGKSTWLRAVGLNALLAQTVCTCFAKSWSGPPVLLTTSLRQSDSLLAGRSYYLAEAEGIRAALRTLGASPRPLCVLDEIFRGTNSIERVAASTAVLRHLAAQGALVLAATHDHSLTALLDGLYQNFHFSERIGASGLDFDYALKPGPASTRNALALLRFLGYPESVVVAAEKLRDDGDSREAGS